MAKNRKYSPEFREEAVKLALDSSRAIAEVARELGINEGTLGNWVNKYRREHADEEPPLDIDERARLRELERENRELRMENEFVKKGLFGDEYGSYQAAFSHGRVSSIGPAESITRASAAFAE